MNGISYMTLNFSNFPICGILKRVALAHMTIVFVTLSGFQYRFLKLWVETVHIFGITRNQIFFPKTGNCKVITKERIIFRYVLETLYDHNEVLVANFNSQSHDVRLLLGPSDFSLLRLNIWSIPLLTRNELSQQTPTPSLQLLGY